MKYKQPEQRMVLRIVVFGILFVASVMLATFGFVRNSQGAISRYNQLIAVDQAGGDVEAALSELRSYIYSHMNTQIGSETGIRPPIQLKGTYERLVAAEEARAASANEKLYAEAQEYCERTQSQGFFGATRLQCVEGYVDQNGVDVQPKEINDDLYKFDFVPPRWSPDMAGLGVLSAIIFAVAWLIQMAVYLRTRSMVRH